MKEMFNRIWELALPYQDQREDIGHAKISLKYAQELMDQEDGDEDAIIPAIVLHDIGWSQLIKGRRMLVFARSAKEEDKLEVQLEHQKESVRLASDILKKVNYPDDLTQEILEIISQHDTRKGFISKNDGLVRDADKLWRTSKEGFTAAAARSLLPRDDSQFKKLEENMKKADYFFSETARKIAFKEFELRKEGR